jgi:hypothetical protein
MQTCFRMTRLIASSVLILALGACGGLPLPEATSNSTAQSPTLLSTTDALEVLASLSRLSPDAQHQELLKPRTGHLQNASSLFRFALLLGRDSDVGQQERGLKILDGLDGADARAQAVIDLARTGLIAQIEAHRQAQRAGELQDRIDQIKALEKSLQQRDVKPAPR